MVVALHRLDQADRPVGEDVLVVENRREAEGQAPHHIFDQRRVLEDQPFAQCGVARLRVAGPQLTVDRLLVPPHGPAECRWHRRPSSRGGVRLRRPASGAGIHIGQRGAALPRLLRRGSRGAALPRLLRRRRCPLLRPVLRRAGPCGLLLRRARVADRTACPRANALPRGTLRGARLAGTIRLRLVHLPVPASFTHGSAPLPA